MTKIQELEERINSLNGFISEYKEEDKKMTIDIFYEGFKKPDKCNRCLVNQPNYMFIGIPRTQPDVLIWICESCYRKLPKNIFRVPLEIKINMEKRR